MPLSKDLIVVANPKETIALEIGEIVSVKITHTNPARVRNSIMSFDFVTSFPLVEAATAGGTPAAEGEEGYTDSALLGSSLPRTLGGTTSPVPETNVRNQMRLLVSSLGKALQQSLINYITTLQENSIAYKKVDVEFFKTVESKATGASAATVVGSVGFGGGRGRFSQATRRYKCGSGLVGDRPVSGKANHRVLSFSLYGKNLENYQDKPGRVLVSGVPFETYFECAQEPAVSNLLDALSKDILISVAGVSLSLKPVVLIGDQYRLISLVQLEGIRNVAGKSKFKE